MNNSDIIFSLNEVLEWTTEAQLSLTLLSVTVKVFQSTC